MATIVFAGSDFFADPGPLIIPVSVVAGGEKRGMMAMIVKEVPNLAKTLHSVCRAGLLKAGGSFTIRLCFGNGTEQYGKWLVRKTTHTRTLILMGLAIGPGRQASAKSALESIADQIKEWHLSEVALHVPSEEALAVAEKAIGSWPKIKVRIYHPEWDIDAEQVS
jgi:hypothetical protein